jgi:hypothetical protein
MNRFATLAALVCCAAGPLRAQWRFDAALAGTREIVHSRAGAGAARFTGSVLGGEAVAARGALTVRLRYAQGSLANDSAARDLAAGEALLGYEPRPWLGLWVGPQARTFIAPGLSDRRWLFWTGRARAHGAIFPGRLDSFVEAWVGLSGRLSRPAASARGGGVELGLETRLPGKPFWGRLAYGVEQGRAAGGFRETIEGFTLTLGYRHGAGQVRQNRASARS